MLVKIFASAFGFVVTFLGRPARAEREWVDIKLGLDELEVLGTDFGNILLTNVENVLNEVPLQIGPIPIGNQNSCPRGSFVGGVTDWDFQELEDGDVNFEVAENPNNPTRSALIFLSLKDITLDILLEATINGRYNPPVCLIPSLCQCNLEAKCDFEPTGQISIEEIGLRFKLSIEEDGLTFTFEPEDPQLDTDDLDITLKLNIGEGSGVICEIIAILDILDDLINAIIEIIIENLEIVDIIIDAIVEAVPPVMVMVPEPVVQFPVAPGRNFALSIFFTTLQGDPEFFRTQFTAKFKGLLSEPTWRNGYSYTPELSNRTLPEVVNEAQWNSNIGSSGINTGVASAWYLIWSTISTDEASADSPLCQASTSDPCLFPPIITTFDIDNDLAIYKALNIYFYGLFKSINFSFVLLPPELKFTKNNTINGMATAQVLLEGNTSKKDDVFLIQLSVDVYIASTIPQLNTTEQMFCCWEIKVIVGTPHVESFNPLYAVNAISLQSLAIVIQEILQSIIIPIVKDINEQIEEFLDEFMFQWPIIPGIPSSDEGVEISLTPETNAITVVPEMKKSDVQDVLQVTGGIILTVVDNPL